MGVLMPQCITQNPHCVEGHWAGRAAASPGPLSGLKLEPLQWSMVYFLSQPPLLGRNVWTSQKRQRKMQR